MNLNLYFPEGEKWPGSDPEYTWENSRLFLFEVAADGTLYDISHNPAPGSNLTPAQACINHGY